MKNKNYVMSLYCGDTYLDVYGSIDKDELDIGHVGGVDIAVINPIAICRLHIVLTAQCQPRNR